MKNFSTSNPSTENSFKDSKKLQVEIHEMLNERLENTVPLTDQKHTSSLKRKKNIASSNKISKNSTSLKNFSRSVLLTFLTIATAFFIYLAVEVHPLQHICILLLFLQIFNMLCSFDCTFASEYFKKISKRYILLIVGSMVLIAFSLVITKNFLGLGASITSTYPIIGSAAEDTLEFTNSVYEELIMIISTSIY